MRNRTYLDDLGHAIREFARGEGLEEGGVDEDVLGLPERADEVLSVRRVDRGLAPHARVDHCEESRRDLHETHAAHAAVPECAELEESEKRNGKKTHNVAATKPARSPMTPPPSARITVSRVHLFRRRKSSIAALPSRLFEVSPGGIVCVRKRNCLPRRVNSSLNSFWKASRCRRAMFVSVMRT